MVTKYVWSCCHGQNNSIWFDGNWTISLHHISNYWKRYTDSEFWEAAWGYWSNKWGGVCALRENFPNLQLILRFGKASVYRWIQLRIAWLCCKFAKHFFKIWFDFIILCFFFFIIHQLIFQSSVKNEFHRILTGSEQSSNSNQIVIHSVFLH